MVCIVMQFGSVRHCHSVEGSSLGQKAREKYKTWPKLEILLG